MLRSLRPLAQSGWLQHGPQQPRTSSGAQLASASAGGGQVAGRTSSIECQQREPRERRAEKATGGAQLMLHARAAARHRSLRRELSYNLVHSVGAAALLRRSAERPIASRVFVGPARAIKAGPRQGPALAHSPRHGPGCVGCALGGRIRRYAWRPPGGPFSTQRHPPCCSRKVHHKARTPLAI